MTGRSDSDDDEPNESENGEDDTEDVEEDEEEDDEEDENDEEDNEDDEVESDEDEDEDKPIKQRDFEFEKPGINSGSTGIVALLKGNQLYVANVGDSRCVLCREGESLWVILFFCNI